MAKQRGMRSFRDLCTICYIRFRLLCDGTYENVIEDPLPQGWISVVKGYHILTLNFMKFGRDVLCCYRITVTEIETETTVFVQYRTEPKPRPVRF